MGLRRSGGYAALTMVLGLVGPQAPARGDLIRYEYGGVLTSADPSTGMAPGMRFSGTFAYDPAEKAQSGPSVPEGSRYDYGRAGTILGPPEPAGSGLAFVAAPADAAGLTATIGGKPFSSQVGGLSLTNFGPGSFGDTPAAPKTAISITNAGLGGPTTDFISLSFFNTDHPVYPTLAPPAALRLGDFTTALFGVDSPPGNPPSATILQGTIDTLIPIPAPEPSTALLIGVAVAAYLARARARRA